MKNDPVNPWLSFTSKLVLRHKAKVSASDLIGIAQESYRNYLGYAAQGIDPEVATKIVEDHLIAFFEQRYPRSQLAQVQDWLLP